MKKKFIEGQIKMDLDFKGVTSVQNKEIKVIEGAFGEGQKCILASDVAIQHETRLDKINDLIKNNISRFNENDLIDFLKPSEGLRDFLNGQQPLRDFAKENGLISNNRTLNVFLLSERGYIKLVSMMDNTKESKWEIMNKILDDYFSMREIIKSDKTLKALAVLKAIEGESFEAKVQGIEEYAGYKKQEGIEEGKAIGIEEGKILGEDIGVEKGKIIGEDIGIKKAINKHDENYENYGGNLFVKKLKIFIKPYGLKYQQLNTATDLNKFLVFKGYGKFVKSTERAHFKPNEEFIGLCNKNGWGECSRMETGGYRMKYSEKFMEVFIVRKVNDEYLAYLKSLIKKKVVIDEMPECPF